MAISLSNGRVTGWMAKPRPPQRGVGAPWSANDIIMVIGWVMVLPCAAARFQHDILAPPFSGLSEASTFLVASASALAELMVAAVMARVLGTLSRKAAQHLIHRCRNSQIGCSWLRYVETLRPHRPALNRGASPAHRPAPQHS